MENNEKATLNINMTYSLKCCRILQLVVFNILYSDRRVENVNQSNDQLVSGKQDNSRLRAPSQFAKSHENEVYYEQGKFF